MGAPHLGFEMWGSTNLIQNAVILSEVAEATESKDLHFYEANSARIVQPYH